MAPNTGGAAPLLNGTTDIDPYAYPYFHAGCDAPLVFELINKFGSIIAAQNDVANNNSNGNIDAVSTSNSISMVGSLPSQARLERLGRKILSRCLAKPDEVCWKDSCGDTALHRLCQIARYPPPQGATSEDPVFSASDLITQIARALIEAYPEGVGTLNKWKETPLHQFVAHCGIYGNDDDSDNLLSFQMSMELVKLLCTGHTSSFCNYVGSYPLHDACELSQGYGATTTNTTEGDFFRREDNNNFVDQFGNVLQHKQQTHDAMSMSSSFQEDEKNNNEEMMKVHHLSIIKHLVRCHPEALFARDNAGLTPLHRAVASWKCNVDIIVYLMEQMEKYGDATTTLRDAIVRSYYPTQLTSSAGSAYMHSPSLSMHGHHHRRGPVLPPLQILWEQICSCHEPGRPDKTISNIILSALSSHQAKESDPHKLVSRLGALWDKIVVLLKAATHGTTTSASLSDKYDNNNRFLLVHATIAFSCPLSVTALAIRLYPEQLLVPDQEYGMTPLLIASSSWGALSQQQQQVEDKEYDATNKEKSFSSTTVMHMNCSDGMNGDFGFQHLAAEFWWPEQYQQMALELVHTVLQMNPIAAKIPDVKTKRLPFHVAISTSGFYWDECLKSLFEAEPRALVTRDPITHLYPFALAAVSEDDAMKTDPTTHMKPGASEECNPVHTTISNTTRNQSTSDRDDIERTTTIFSLLREDPSMLALSI